MNRVFYDVHSINGLFTRKSTHRSEEIFREGTKKWKLFYQTCKLCHIALSIFKFEKNISNDSCDQFFFMIFVLKMFV